MRAQSRNCVALCLLGVAACGAAPAARPTRLELDYTFAPNAELDRMGVRICSPGRWPETLVPIHADGARRVRHVWLDSGGFRAPLATEARIESRGFPPGACVELDLDLSADSGSSMGPVRTERGAFWPTSAWLWTPWPRPEDLEATAHFAMPAAMRRSALFREESEGAIVLDDDAFHFVSYAAFGDLEEDVVVGPDGCLEVATLDGGMDGATRRAWLSAALETIAELGPSLLPPRASVVLIPIRAGSDPSAPVFGLAAHGAVPSILLLPPMGADLALLHRDWTLVHELVHLTTPHVGGEGAWLTEGLATYYQEVLRARAGRITADEAWRTLDAGFQRGLTGASSATLRAASASMHETGSYSRIYWSGTAVALLSDLTLRRSGSSLDAAMARAATRRTIETSDIGLGRILDGAENGPVTQLIERWGAAIEPPDLRAAYAELGLTRNGGALTLSPDGEALRAAIMNPRASRPSETVDCAGASSVSSAPPSGSM